MTSNFWIATENLITAILSISINFEGTSIGLTIKAVDLINEANIPLEKFIFALRNTGHINIIDNRIHKTERGESFFNLLSK